MKYLIAFILLLFSMNVYADEQSVYDRVTERGEIRCGYLPWKYFVDIDPNTGEFSGIVVDYMEQLGANLGLEIKWVEEVGRGDYPQGLKQGRYDVYCTSLTVTAERARVSDFVQPFVVSLFEVFVRDGDTRFDYNLDALNSEEISFIAGEGDVFSKIIRNRFPKARLVELPQLSTDADPLMFLATGKADAIVMNSHIGATFMRNNPNQIRKVELDSPLRYIPISVVTKYDEYRFTRMLDMATREMLDNGSMDRILSKYGVIGDSFLPIAPPYKR